MVDKWHIMTYGTRGTYATNTTSHEVCNEEQAGYDLHKAGRLEEGTG